MRARSERPTAVEKPSPIKPSPRRTVSSSSNLAVETPTVAEKLEPLRRQSSGAVRRDSSESRATRVEKELPLEVRAAAARKQSRASIAMESAAHYGGRYEIRGLLGVGGMAAVYRAKDSWLGDDVALKVLSRDHADSPEAVARFYREASLARRITHRNVIRVFDVGVAGGEQFLTMQLVEGAPLLTRMGTPLPLTFALDVGIQLAHALEAVHAAGVLHGDVKPENVLLETVGTRVVLTDFGVSRRLEDPPPPPLPGHAGGTPIYMAPEQIEGGKLSARTDLYALGIVIYEMIAGGPPWSLERGSTAATMSRLAVPPTSLRVKNAGVPADLDDLVMRLLDRERSRRPGSATEVAARLQALADFESQPTSIPQAPTAREGRGMVGPSQSLTFTAVARPLAVTEVKGSGEGKSGYLAEAFTTELIERLSRAPRVRVATRMAQKLVAGDDEERRQLGRKLDVEGLVEGKLALRLDGALEVTVRLMNPETGQAIWEKTAERKAQDIFKLTADLADEIAHAFARPASSSPGFARTESSPNSHVQIHAAGTSNVQASAETQPEPHVPAPPSSTSSPELHGAPSRRSDRDILVRVREAWASGTADDSFRAERMLTERHAEAKEDSRATALLAVAKLRRWTFDPRVSEGRQSLVEEAEALLAPLTTQGTPPIAEAMFAHGLLAWLRLEPTRALIHLKDTLRLDATYADAHQLFGRILGDTGDFDDSETSLMKAMKNNSLHVPAGALMARNMELAGKRSRADEWLAWGEMNAGDHPEMLLVRLRIARWRRDAEAMKQLRPRAIRTSESVRGVLASALRVAAGANEDVELGRLAASASMPGAAQAMTATWMQLIAEQRANAGDLPGVLSAIRSVDGAGSFDIAWLDGCPLLEKVRASSALGPVRAQIERRAKTIRAR